MTEIRLTPVMPESDFTNREISAMLEEIRRTLVRIEHTVNETKLQAAMIDSRVTALELINSNKMGMNSVLKYIAGMAVALLIGYLSWIGLQVNEINKTLSQYEVTII